MSQRRLTRRTLLMGTAAVAGGGLVLSLTGEDAEDIRLAGREDILEPNAYLQITPTGEIILQVDKSEMGQGVMTGFVTLLAEELDCRPEQISPRTAPVHALFQDPTQLTGESRSMRQRFTRIREVGAQARTMLVAAAARRWEIDPEEVEVTGVATLINRLDGRELGYGELAAAAAGLRVPRNVELRAPERYRYIGQSVARPDVPAKVTGDAGYGIDVSLANLATAVIRRPPRPGDTLLRFDATRAEQIKGVRAIIEVPAGIAVIADGFWPAKRAADAIDAEWQDGPMAGWDIARIRAEQREQLDTQAGAEARNDGDVEAALADSAATFDAEYFTPYLAHLTMEPQNATVHLQADRCDIWAPVQAPDIARQVAVKLTGLTREQVHVHTTLLGGGFGRRALNDFVAEAVTVAQAVDGPVKLIWTREEDVRYDFFRSATTHRLKAGLDAGGRVVAWHHRLVAPLLSYTLMQEWLETLFPEWVAPKWSERAANLSIDIQSNFFGPFQAWEGAGTMRYGIDNVQVDAVGYNPPVQVGIWRSVGNSYNGFVVESFIDELAHRAGEDPLQFRRQRLSEHPRQLAVIDRLIEASGWNQPPAGRFQGAAVHECYGTVIGQVAEVSVADGQIRVHKVTCVVDCGTVINPDIVRQQIEGGVIFGLTAALYGEIDIEDGYIRPSNFHDQRMLRLKDAPDVEVHLIPGTADPGGIGEAGVPCIAPAVANALFRATGVRQRELPLK